MPAKMIKLPNGKYRVKTPNGTPRQGDNKGESGSSGAPA